MNDLSRIYYKTDAAWQLDWLKMEKVLEYIFDGDTPSAQMIDQALVIWNS